jgi:hypothetical protein
MVCCKIVPYLFLPLIMFLTVTTGCADLQNTKDIAVYVCVEDSLTNKPLPNAKITLLCWYYAPWDKTDYKYLDTVTNKKGCFVGHFKRGYKIVAASVTTSHAPELKEERVIGRNMKVNLKLRSSNADYSSTDLREFIIQETLN